MPTLSYHDLLLSLLLVTTCLMPATAQDAIEDQDLEAVKQSADRFVKAYNEGSSEAIGNLFTEAAEYVDGAGNVFHGREAIVAEYVAFFKEVGGGTIQINMDNVRFVAPGVLMEEGRAKIEPPNGTVGATTESSYIAVHAKQEDGTWLMASVRSTPDEEINAHEELKKLAWLVGDWVDESEESVVSTHWEWSDCGNYLLGTFRILAEGDELLYGTHRIGWDASRDKCRSWVFDSRGGFVQGLWTQVENGWVVKIAGVTADGETATATNRCTS